MTQGRAIWLRRAAVGALGLASVTFAAEAHRVLAGRNLHALIPGVVYRCAQPTPADLADAVQRFGIRSVINLRGNCDPFPWYLDEARATADLDLTQDDFTFSANRLPPPAELRRLVDTLDRCPKPVLIHCRRGVDRTGLTAVAVLLLWTNADLPAARWQLCLRFGHVPLGRTAAMLRFFSLYEQWLAGDAHTPERFRRFATAEYCPGPCRGRLELIAEPQLSTTRPGAARLRAVNESVEPWQFRPGTGTGIHVRYALAAPDGTRLQDDVAGLFAAVVPPGESVEITLPLARVPAAGSYRVRAELVNGHDCTFGQMGVDPFEFDAVAR